MQHIDSTQAETEAQALAALVDAQLEEVVCGGWSRTTWERIVPDTPILDG
jgi:hypothetical protein